VELINFVGRANDADTVLRSWSPEDSDRLDAIRSRHDPAGMFPFGRHGTRPPGGPGDPRNNVRL